MKFAIVGMSSLLPGSGDTDGFWASVVAGRDCIRDVPSTHWLVDDYFDPDPAAPDKTYARRGGFLDPVSFDPLAFGITPNSLEATDTSQLLALLVAERALRDYGRLEELGRERVSVILGTAGTELLGTMAARMQRPVWLKAMHESGLEEQRALKLADRISEHYVPWQEATFPGLLGNVVAGRIANRFDLHGTNCTTDAACASSLAALSLALNELALGQADLVLTGGVDTLNDPVMFTCFSKTPALSPTGDCRPFSAAADGTVLGEGLVMLAVRRLEDAVRDGERIYAVIAGLGTSSDGRDTAVYAPHPEGQARALRRAYEQVGFGPESVDLVEAHGTGTRAGDAAEFAALRQVFAEAGGERSGWCALGSVKSQIGHTKCTAGVAGLLKAALALHHKVLPPTIKVDAPNPALAVEGSPFYLNTRARPWIKPVGQPRRAGVSSFGFGGSNFHVVLEEYLPAAGEGRSAETLRALPSTLLAFSGSSRDELIARLEEAARTTNPASVVALASYRAFRSVDRCRLALVAEEGQELQARLAEAVATVRGADRGDAAPGVYLAEGAAEPGEVALLFSGQGSQYPGMGEALAVHHPVARKVWDRASSVLRKGRRLDQLVFPPPVQDRSDAAAQEEALRRTEWAQPALAAVGSAAAAVLLEAGLRPVRLAGHSFGELTALHVAGVLSADDLLQVARRRGELMRDACTDPGAMLAVAAGAEELADLVESTEGTLCVANLNGPKQTVLSGCPQAVSHAASRLKELGVGSSPLRTAGAFHSPLMEPAVRPLRDALAGVDITAGRLPVHSNIDGLPFPDDPDLVRDRLAHQLTEPVRFGEVVEALYASGVRVFVEVGAGRVLTSLIGDILTGRDHLAVATDVRGTNSVTALQHALAALAVRGVPLDLASLEAGRRARGATEPHSELAVEISGTNHNKRYPTPARSIPVTEPRPVSPTDSDSFVVPAAPALPTVMDFTESTPPASTPAPSPSAMADPQWLALVADAQRHTADAHATFQRAMAESHIAFLKIAEASLRGPYTLAADAPSTSATADPPRFAPPAPPLSDAPTPPPLAPAVGAAEPAAPPVAVPAPIPTRPTAPTSPAAVGERIEDVLLEAVSEKTGYPVDMLASRMDLQLEAELGIDSIKRVEILGAVKRRVPGFPALGGAELAGLRTVGEILEHVHQAVGGNRAREHRAPGAEEDGHTDGASLPPPVRIEEMDPVAVPVPAPGIALKGIRDGELLIIGGSSDLTREIAALLAEAGVHATAGTEATPQTSALLHLGGLSEITALADGARIQRNAFAQARTMAGRLTTGAGLFVTVQDTGGTFGLDAGSSTGHERCWAGGLAALPRTLRWEWPQACVKAIDCAQDGREARAVAEALVAELLFGGTADAGLKADGTRVEPRLRPAAPAPADADVLGEDPVLVVTGGARGITAACLQSLIRTRPARILLLGRTALTPEPPGLEDCATGAELRRALLATAPDSPVADITRRSAELLAQREIRASVRSLESCGATVAYAAADITNGQEVQDAVAAVRARWGPVTGVVHGAGVIRDRRIGDKRDADFDEVFDTKVTGLCNVMDAVGADPLRLLCLFSSGTALFGRPGQSDYGMANETLNHLAAAAYARRPDCTVRSLAWGPWDGGMVGSAQAALFSELDCPLIPLEAGAQRFLASLRRAAPTARTAILADGSLEPLSGATLDTVGELHVDASTHPQFTDHAITGTPVVPLAWLMEWCTALTAQWAGHPEPVALHDVRVLRRIALDGFPQEAHRFVVRAIHRGEHRRRHLFLESANGTVHCTAEAGPAIGAQRTWDVPRSLPPAVRKGLYDGHTLFHGPAFQAIRELGGVGPTGAWARVEGTASRTWPGPTPLTDPLAVDAAVQVAVLWAEQALRAATLPMGIRQVRMHLPGPMPGTALCVVAAVHADDTSAECDVALLSADGAPAVELLGLQLVRRPEGAASGA
ncbi:SDR family NAD(P)-dependent oxidoreductase [Streptomyces sp. NPDC002564]|uniref:SDR family NAD(P)-dependent oxidoreductase n=1 Tax=Streptomyces sp. NPDC002564 TaxID=3364649 RepID=UPI0036AFFE78